MAGNISPELSRQLMGAIRQALQEEKKPAGKRWLKVLSASSFCTLILAAPLLLLFRDQISLAWRVAILAWWIYLTTGFHFYYAPQPRISVPGYWSPWILSKVLLAMVLLTGVEILLCPSFVFLESPLSWRPFELLTMNFMAVGGMGFCMFSCGFIFSSVGGLVTFGLISKTLQGSSWRGTLKASTLAYFTQLPIVGIQLADAGLRPFAIYWMLGGLLGTTLMAGGVRLALFFQKMFRSDVQNYG